jgi:hypothetical protein
MAGPTSPHLVDGNAPLEALMMRALRRYGDQAPSTIDAETFLMFIDFGNSVLDDVMGHPYWPVGKNIDYYYHQTEVREVPDAIMLAGILYMYALDQESKKAPRYQADYYQKMNQVLARDKFGVAAEFEMSVIDRPKKSPIAEG